VRGNAGFTLVELMITVAIIAVLVAVAIPQFTRTSRKSRASEVQAVFAELHQRQSEYHFANGTYFSTGTGETDIFPAAPVAASQSIAVLPASWETLKVRPTYQKLYCGYVAIAGAAGSATGLGTKAGQFGLINAPNTDWYYLLARCNLDGNAARDSYYFSWSGDPAVKKQNEGS
jgi:prepilin-type N-terminal cleavage/methylation domain-containing protein